MCGDYAAALRISSRSADTTPRVRGLPYALDAVLRERRYNPACAGTTYRVARSGLPTSIQPRVCGDYHVDGWHCYHRTDTTPRVRGLRPARARRWRPTRYNPACAGTTYEHYTQKQESTIQPRVCGDYRLTSCRRISGFDTTPRVRGLRYLKERRKNKNRYNPACAGTTPSIRPVFVLSSIQPRVCGDYATLAVASRLTPDTTPRVRGLRFLFRIRLNPTRYNPACAGTTVFRCMRKRTESIQPRVCGDYSSASLSMRRYSRYNPACAGTTNARRSGGPLRTIQPRVCGDYLLDVCRPLIAVDTTPRVRGLHSSVLFTQI